MEEKPEYTKILKALMEMRKNKVFSVCFAGSLPSAGVREFASLGVGLSPDLGGVCYGR